MSVSGGVTFFGVLAVGFLVWRATDRVRSDFDTYFRNLLSNQPLMDREKAVGTTQARFGQLSPVYGSEDWPGEGGGGWAVIRIIGGSATPTAWNTAPEQPGAAARSRSLLPP